MHNNTRALFAALLVMTMSACHFADVEAIEQHMLRECLTVPLAPSCAFSEGNEAQSRTAFERYARRHVTRAETEACILAVDCSDDRLRDDADAMVDELLACTNDDPGAQSIEADREARSAECVDECDLSLLDCGADNGCDVGACFVGHEVCVAGC
jgi:hypothetical protein